MRTVEENKALLEKYPILRQRNVYTGEPIDDNDEYTYLDTMPQGWAKAYRSGFAELLDAVPPAKSFLLENGTTGVRVLDKILSDREAFGRVFKPNQDPVSMLIELHAIAHEVNQTKAPAVQVTETAPAQATKKTAIGRPGQGQGGAPGELHGRDLILHMRKVAQGGRRD